VDPSPPTATERAYRWTKGAILSGILAGGTLVSEGDIAREADVSRTPVREAFLRLAAEGLLSLYPKRGALVVAVTPQEVADVIGARLVLECWAVERAALSPEATRVAEELHDWVGVQESRLDAGDDPGFHVADRAFHETLLAAAGNGLLTGFYGSLRDRQLRMAALLTSAGGDRAVRTIAEHSAIAAAIAAGDAVAAVATMRAHIASTGALFGAAEAVTAEAVTAEAVTVPNGAPDLESADIDPATTEPASTNSAGASTGPDRADLGRNPGERRSGPSGPSAAALPADVGPVRAGPPIGAEPVGARGAIPGSGGAASHLG
jgi:DNA-binding GntR family transcriptional regulator